MSCSFVSGGKAKDMQRSLLAALLALGMIAGPASAKVAHTVQPGETLWSIAAASNLTTRTVAAFNGLSPDANVVLGSTIWIPSEAEGAAALGATQTAAAPAQAPAQAPVSQSEPPPVLGAYVVQPGDSLSAIAARHGVSAQQVAAANGLDPAGVLMAGIHLKLPTGAEAAGAAPAPQPASAVPEAAPGPSPERVTSGQVAEVAAAHGVPASLASAIAWQESGFNNSMVSSANARGVMQIMPGTWDWVQQNLAGGPLDPNSAADNVHAGVMYLGQLLRDTGGDPAQAAAAYYQGLGSVRSRGFFPETQQYVNNVLALRSRFGG